MTPTADVQLDTARPRAELPTSPGRASRPGVSRWRSVGEGSRRSLREAPPHRSGSLEARQLAKVGLDHGVWVSIKHIAKEFGHGSRSDRQHDDAESGSPSLRNVSAVRPVEFEHRRAVQVDYDRGVHVRSIYPSVETVKGISRDG